MENHVENVGIVGIVLACWSLWTASLQNRLSANQPMCFQRVFLSRYRVPRKIEALLTHTRTPKIKFHTKSSNFQSERARCLRKQNGRQTDSAMHTVKELD